MLKFYKQSSDSFTDRVERKLRDMVVAHEIVRVDSSGSLPGEVGSHDLPVLSDSHQVWTTPKKIDDFLEELHQELREGRSMQSDSCHIDPDNPGQCL